MGVSVSRGWQVGAADPAERARLRAFPIVKKEVKLAKLEEFKRLA